MTFDDEVVLIGHGAPTTTPAGDTIAPELRRYSYAAITTPAMRETYEGLARGLKPEMVVILPSWVDDYHGETEVEHNGVRYYLIRAAEDRNGTAKLVVSRFKAGVS